MKSEKKKVNIYSKIENRNINIKKERDEENEECVEDVLKRSHVWLLHLVALH